MDILLRKVEGASVALVKFDAFSIPELLPTRYDLFQYRGGVSWGYKGTGVRNLAYAIAARVLEDTPEKDLSILVEYLVQNVLCFLNGDQEHIIDQKALDNAIQDSGV